MVKIYALDGYKYIGDRPEAPIGHDMGLFRDNLTYISLSFSNWKEDRKMIVFILEEHINYLDIEMFDNLFSSYIKDNAIAKIHITIKEHTDESDGNTALMVSNKQPKGINTLIAYKKKFYNQDLPLREQLAWDMLSKSKRTSRNV